MRKKHSPAPGLINLGLPPGVAPLLRNDPVQPTLFIDIHLVVIIPRNKFHPFILVRLLSEPFTFELTLVDHSRSNAFGRQSIALPSRDPPRDTELSFDRTSRWRHSQVIHCHATKIPETSFIC